MELRLVLTVDDWDAAVELFRDGLGMTELPAFESSGGRIALVFALAGAKGNFGLKSSADTALPEEALTP